MLTDKRGLSLIELVVTLLILTMGVAALIKFQANYFYYYDVAKQKAEALVIAKNKLEVLRTFQVIATTTGFVAYNDIVSGTANTTGTNATYTNTWTVTTFTTPNYKTVAMVVTWADRRGVNQSVALDSIISQTDPVSSGLVFN